MSDSKTLPKSPSNWAAQHAEVNAKNIETVSSEDAAFNNRLAKAMRQRKLGCPGRMRQDDQGRIDYEEYNVCQFNSKDQQAYGIGIFLYFSFIKRLIKLFAIIALLYLPALFFFVSSGRSTRTPSLFKFERTMLGNMGDNLLVERDENGTITNNASEFENIEAFGLSMDKEAIGIAVAVLDFVICIVFLIAFYFIARAQTRESLSYFRRQLTISNYSVMVTGLDPHFANRQKLKEWFESRFGKVFDVAFVFDDHKLIAAYAERGLLKRQLVGARRSRNSQKVALLENKLENYDRHLARMKAGVQIKRTVAAFITFDSIQSRAACLRAFPTNWFGRWRMPDALVFEGERVLHVKAAAEPSNLHFAHLSSTTCQRYQRRCLTTFASILLIALSFGLVYAAEVGIRRTPRSKECPKDTYSLPTATEQERECYCLMNGLSVIMDSECDDYRSEYFVEKALIFTIVFGITAFNYLLRFTMRKLGRWELHISVTNEEVAIMWKILVSQFINTALVLLLVNADLAFEIPGFFNISFGGEFDDFTYDWFQKVGSSLVLTMIVLSFAPPILSLMRLSFNRCRRNPCCLSRGLTQLELNKKLQGSSFELNTRYSTMLNIMFVCMFYGAGMPILIFVGLFAYCVWYWVEKYIFVRLYRIPPRYDHSLAKVAVDLMPMALIVHIALAMWMYTAPPITQDTLFGDDPTGGLSDFADSSPLPLGDRLSTTHVVLLLILFFVLLFWKLGSWLLPLSCCDSDHLEVQAMRMRDKKFITMTQAVEKYSNCLESYHAFNQPKYRDAFVRTKSMRQMSPDLSVENNAELKMGYLVDYQDFEGAKAMLVQRAKENIRKQEERKRKIEETTRALAAAKHRPVMMAKPGQIVPMAQPTIVDGSDQKVPDMDPELVKIVEYRATQSDVINPEQTEMVQMDDNKGAQLDDGKIRELGEGTHVKRTQTRWTGGFSQDFFASSAPTLDQQPASPPDMSNPNARRGHTLGVHDQIPDDVMKLLSPSDPFAQAEKDRIDRAGTLPPIDGVPEDQRQSPSPGPLSIEVKHSDDPELPQFDDEVEEAAQGVLVETMCPFCHFPMRVVDFGIPEEYQCPRCKRAFTPAF